MSEKPEIQCLMCKWTYLNIARHLKMAHRCVNQQERSILVKWATGHNNFCSCPCPVNGCKYKPGNHLERHIINTHPELSVSKQQEMLSRARTIQAMLLLGELWATMSTPSMVLDFDKRELDAPASQVVEQPTSSEDQVCFSVPCTDLLKSNKSELDKLDKIRVDLEARVAEQQHTITTYKRLVASLRRRLAPAGVDPTAHPVKRQD
ncbi:hypothetical protein XENOCAPTIV_007131 [Xenoophorus captivus]|uniref:C2H2-type domain-containing protein n=1 Tax=Xenoophorus captivus TaxID=1517983 RepID=A0ABV0RY44_9TELE